jgi:hypothetical protein
MEVEPELEAEKGVSSTMEQVIISKLAVFPCKLNVPPTHAAYLRPQFHLIHRTANSPSAVHCPAAVHSLPLFTALPFLGCGHGRHG